MKHWIVFPEKKKGVSFVMKLFLFIILYQNCGILNNIGAIGTPYKADYKGNVVLISIKS